MNEYYQRSVDLHKKHQGKIAMCAKVDLESEDAMSLVYTPGVGRPCEEIRDDPKKTYELTCKGNTVAVVTDGSAVLGLGNIGPEAALPVMEGKALLFKKYANVDAWPICLATQDVDEIVETVRRIAPGFGGINLEDIAAPACFAIEERLQDLGIPVFHDDQHGTAAVVLAGLVNACERVLNKPLQDLSVTIVGAGAAGIAIARLLAGVHDGNQSLVKDIVLCDSKGIVSAEREDLDPVKQSVLSYTNKEKKKGSLKDALQGADVFIGVSRAGLLSEKDIALMNPGAVVFALANPEPEIWPDEAKRAGAAIVATGRSDLPNQVNNVQIFPGLFRGALDAGVKQITQKMIRDAAYALAACLENPSVDQILPPLSDLSVPKAVADAL